VVDAASRRAQLQGKVGVGMSPKEFSAAMKDGTVGHQGLSASLRIIAKGLGITLDKTAESLFPLITEYQTRSSVLGPVEEGHVRGIRQVARGFRGRRELITLEVRIALDEPNAGDTIDIVGEPPIRFSGELPGDSCTVATVLSAIPVVVTMQPGLRTVLDVPLEQPEEPVSSHVHRLAIPRSATELPAAAAKIVRLPGPEASSQAVKVVIPKRPAAAKGKAAKKKLKTVSPRPADGASAPAPRGALKKAAEKAAEKAPAKKSKAIRAPRGKRRVAESRARRSDRR
jgi:hypothetical protein